MVDAARQPLIEVKTFTEVEKVEGYVGNFVVTLREKASMCARTVAMAAAPAPRLARWKSPTISK